MVRVLREMGLDLTRFHVAHGPTAITYMDMNGTDRVHGDYVEGVLENMVFDAEDIAFAARHDLVHTALWGKAENVLSAIRSENPAIRISFDYCDRLDHPIIEQTRPFVDYGFFSWHEGDGPAVRDFLWHQVAEGFGTAVATFGEAGSLCYDGREFTACGISPAPHVVNTVGAGDSYIAGFLYGILQGWPVIRCMEKGAEVSAQVVQVFEPWTGQ